jgi:hypothetical protein
MHVSRPSYSKHVLMNDEHFPYTWACSICRRQLRAGTQKSKRKCDAEAEKI